MPAATNREDLLRVTDKEWETLASLIKDMPEDVAMAPGGEEPNVRDILVHRAHWIGLFFQWLDEGDAAQMPDHGVKWNQLKVYNAALRARSSDVTWAEAQARLIEGKDRLRAWIDRSDDATLYGGPMAGGTGWTRGRYAEAAGSSHFRSAARYIRSVKRRA
ncbi:ClbS/DfsB family four-helix bundle protein [Jannaschia sp. CCS1]|uniref:ClbS/DfsB family four-helix bundle protein n=1 Tax=Jannaschia sp. (strain CCS1) TaxID=290400 RepID=UPI000053D3C6|nr:ClbS/DfsB family four-helix bundle protein [Jannaschia sp. CCS1]ABD53680.1 hypothetical protein Jann_0763 [Jannaschia sp. CCS1]